MLTVDTLREYGADTDDAIERCMGKEDFYIMLVGKAIDDGRFRTLRDAIELKDYEAAFEAAHMLKGMLSNLALRPLEEPVKEITELLRNRTDTDYNSLLDAIDAQRARLEALR